MERHYVQPSRDEAAKMKDIAERFAAYMRERRREKREATIYVLRLGDEVEVTVEGDGTCIEAVTADGRPIQLSQGEWEEAYEALAQAKREVA